jgi:hypothetical protein
MVLIKYQERRMSMKEKYYNELNEIFLASDEMQKEHAELFNVICLIVEHIKKTHEIEELNKKLQELNKE